VCFSRWSRRSSDASVSPNVDRPPPERLDEGLADRVLAVGRQRIGDNVEIREKRVAVRVLAGAHVVDAVEPLAHQAELLTVRLVGVALARLLDDRREPFDVGRQRLGEPVVDRVSLAVLTQHGREPLAAVAVLLDGDLALARQRLVGDLRRDERVAVAVGARPRAELEELGAVHVVVLLREMVSSNSS